MFYPFTVERINNNTFLRCFNCAVDIETYEASWYEIIRYYDGIGNPDSIKVITDYTNCKILIEKEEFTILSNFIKSELSFCNKLICASVAECDEKISYLIVWKNEYILHGIIIYGKVFRDLESAIDFILQKP